MDSPHHARKVGLFVLVSLAIVAALLLNFGRGMTLLPSGYNVSVRSGNVGGLKAGANVMMSGVPIGVVRQVTLAEDGRTVDIRCNLESRFKVFADARFEIEQSGFLGDQYVSIVPTRNQGEPLKDGAVVRAQDPFNLQEAVRSAVGLMSKLDSAVTKIDGAVGRVDRILLAEDTLNQLKATIGNFRSMSERADATVANLQTLVATNGLALNGTVSNLNAFSTRLNGLADQLSGVTTNLDGILLTNRTHLEVAMKSLAGAAGDLKSISGDLQAGRGLAGGLLKDEQLHLQVNETVGNLNTLSSNLAKYGLLWHPKTVTPLTNNSRYPGRSPFR